MVELGRFYIREKESGEVNEATFYDAKYINLEKVTFWQIVKRSMRLMFFYLFKKNNVPRMDIYDALKFNAQTIYEQHNEFLLSNNLPVVNYKEAFDKEKIKTKIDYIM